MNTRKKLGGFIRLLPVYGCIATGMIYVGIGVIAILSFLRIREGGADQNSMLALLNDYVVGQIAVWIILLGTLSYIVWSFYETVTDPYDYGTDAKGLTKRAGIALSTIADILIIYAGIRVLLGTGNIQVDGQPTEERQWVGNLLEQSWGKFFVISIGTIILITAVVQLLYGTTRGYRERVKLHDMNFALKYIIQFLALSGYTARGIVLGIIGFFFVKAGIFDDASHVVNTDKAFDFIGDEVGHLYFILVAVGTVCYGLFMFVMGARYNTKKI